VVDRSHLPEYLRMARMANEEFRTVYPHVDNLVDDLTENSGSADTGMGDAPLSTCFLPQAGVIHDFIHGVIHAQIG
jgi:hypothetical protein